MGFLIGTIMVASVDEYQFIFHHPLFSILRIMVAVLWLPLVFDFGRHFAFSRGLAHSADIIGVSCENLARDGEDGKVRLRMWVEDLVVSKGDSDLVRKQKMVWVVESIMRGTMLKRLVRCVALFFLEGGGGVRGGSRLG